MWDMLLTKAAFINQDMSGQITTREAEDVGEMVLTAAEVSAIASGNPLIREHVEVTNEVRRLEALEAAYRNNQIHMQAQVSALEASIPNLRRQIAALEKDIRRRKDTKGDKFAMVVDGKPYTEREEAGKALQASSIAVMKAKPQEARKVGAFAGFDLYTTPSGSDIEVRGEGSYYARVTDTAQGTVRSVESRVATLESPHDATKEDLADRERRLARFKEE